MFPEAKPRETLKSRGNAGPVIKSFVIHCYTSQPKTRQKLQRNCLFCLFVSSAKQQRKMTKFYEFLRTQSAMAKFWCRLLELKAVGACLARANF